MKMTVLCGMFPWLLVITEVSEELAATLFRVAEDLDLSVDGGSLLHRNIGKELSSSVVSSSRGLLSS